MGKYTKQKNNNENRNINNNEQKFYENVIYQMGTLIFHSVSFAIFILLTIMIGVECATSGGYWVYVLFMVITIAIVVYCIIQITVCTCNILLIIKELHDGKKKY